MQQLHTEDDWRAVVEKSQAEPVLVFKHSNACPVSAAARERIVAGVEDNTLTLPLYEVVVQDDRPISNLIAEELGVKHESPQVLLIRDGKSVADTSHHDVSVEFVLSHLT